LVLVTPFGVGLHGISVCSTGSYYETIIRFFRDIVNQFRAYLFHHSRLFHLWRQRKNETPILFWCNDNFCVDFVLSENKKFRIFAQKRN
jgi:hypothetical protein